MKANAPKKIYLSMHPVTGVLHVRLLKSDDTIEYTRTDVFIEKAVNFIAENLSKGTTERLQTKVKFIHNFKKYLEEQV